MSMFECKSLGKFEYADRGRRVFHCSQYGLTDELKCQGCQMFAPFPSFPDVEIAGVIQSAPHRLQYFQRSLKSIMRACDHVEQEIDCGQTGAFPTFVRALTKLYFSHPHASYYLYLQDDTVITGNVASRIFELPKGFAVASLYNPPTIKGWGEKKWKQVNNGWDSPGACCYLFSPMGIRSILSDPYLQWHRRFGPVGGLRAIDGVVGVWASQHGGIWYRWNPLAKHLGEISAIERGG